MVNQESHFVCSLMQPLPVNYPKASARIQQFALYSHKVDHVQMMHTLALLQQRVECDEETLHS